MDFLYFITIIAWCLFIFYSASISFVILVCLMFKEAKGKIYSRAIYIWIVTLAWLIVYYRG